MGNFNFAPTKIEGVYVIKPICFEDDRGFFMETYNKQDFEDNGLFEEFVQDNHSKSRKGVLRGLHFQNNKPQGKVVRVIKGRIYDVAVDLRKSSKTYGEYVSVILSDENKKQFYIPPGFAHGFLTLSEEVEFVYKCTDFYDGDDEGGIIWNDEDINVDWPLDEIGEENLILSSKDINWKSLKETETNF